MLSTAAESDSVPVEEWGGTKYSLGFEDDGEGFVDYSKFVFLDRAVTILASDKRYKCPASNLKDHASKGELNIEDEKWEALKTDSFLNPVEKYEYGEEDFRGNPKTGSEGSEVGRDFLAYQNVLGNLRDDQTITVNPEEVDISRFAVTYFLEEDLG